MKSPLNKQTNLPSVGIEFATPSPAVKDVKYCVTESVNVIKLDQYATIGVVCVRFHYLAVNTYRVLILHEI